MSDLRAWMSSDPSPPAALTRRGPGFQAPHLAPAWVPVRFCRALPPTQGYDLLSGRPGALGSERSEEHKSHPPLRPPHPGLTGWAVDKGLDRAKTTTPSRFRSEMLRHTRMSSRLLPAAPSAWGQDVPGWRGPEGHPGALLGGYTFWGVGVQLSPL